MADAPDTGFLSDILKPGSSLHPTFQLWVDMTFAFLLVVLVTCAFATYSVHFVALTFIALALWGSVKWFIKELQQVPAQEPKKTL